MYINMLTEREREREGSRECSRPEPPYLAEEGGPPNQTDSREREKGGAALP